MCVGLCAGSDSGRATASWERKTSSRPEVPIRGEAPPAPAPEPRPFPIALDAGHDRHIERELRILEDELRYVQRRPSHWRWVVVALYSALGQTLAKHLPGSYQDDPGLGQLSRLFEAVAKNQPEIASARQAVQELDRLRTRRITLAVSEWPVRLTQLPGIVVDCLRVIQRLEPGIEPSIGEVEALVRQP